MGLSTGGEANRPLVIEQTKLFYKACGFEEPKYFVFLDSPMAVQIAGNLLKNTKYTELWSQLGSQLRSQLESQLGSQLWSQLRSQLWSQLGSQLESQLRSQLWSQLESQLRSQLRSQLESQLGSQLRSQLRSQLWSQLESQLRSQLWSQLWSQLRSQKFEWQNIFGGCAAAYYLSFYNFIKDQLLPNEKTEKLDAFTAISKEVFFWTPYNGIVLYSEKPKYHKWNGELLHSKEGPAIEFRDGYSLYALDGVTIPLDIHDLIFKEDDGEKILAIENTEHRLLGIKYFGIDRIFSKLKHKEISKLDDYTLYEVMIEGEPEKLLKMKNPSEDKWHYEWVTPEIKTVPEALAWRMGLDTYSGVAFSA
jgi:hypothetical protein